MVQIKIREFKDRVESIEEKTRRKERNRNEKRTQRKDAKLLFNLASCFIPKNKKASDLINYGCIDF